MARLKDDGFPRGWFMVGFSDELPVGGVLKQNYFGQAQVVYRGEDGQVRIMDGYCPHMGAHIGAGGEVVGNEIRCPFHAWKFHGETGQCTHIPYSDREPPNQAKLNKWKSVERNGMIFVWFDAEGGEPEFNVPVIPPGNGDESWSPWFHSVMRINTHSREIVENVVDIGHFQPVHGTHIVKFENEFTNEQAIQRSGGTAYPRGGGKDKFEIDAIYHGPGFQISDFRGYMNAYLINAHTMIDEDTLDLRFGVSLQTKEGIDDIEKFGKMYVDNLTTGFMEDVEIWENKIFREAPMLCRDDGPIMKLRRWYSQFYQPRAAAE